MSTLIICPACETRYEIAAVLPPEGRKVRCSKCSHVWQATAAGPEQEPGAQALGAPQTPPPPPFQAPRPPQTPQSAQAPQAAQAEAPAINPALRGFAGITRPSQVPPAPPAPQPEPNLPEWQPEPSLPEWRPEGAATDADFNGGGDFEADVVDFDIDVPASRPNGPQLGLPAVAAGTTAAVFEEFSFGSMSDAATSTEPANISIGGEKRKPRPAVAIGWSLLALLVVILGALFVLAPRSVVSMLPGAARLYAMVGMPVNLRGLTFEGVRYGWSTDSGQTVLKVEGDVLNVTSGSVDVPDVVIALHDEAGHELSQWTTKVQGEQLAAGEHAPFVAEIPSPPENVHSLEVRFAKAE